MTDVNLLWRMIVLCTDRQSRRARRLLHPYCILYVIRVFILQGLLQVLADHSNFWLEWSIFFSGFRNVYNTVGLVLEWLLGFPQRSLKWRASASSATWQFYAQIDKAAAIVSSFTPNVFSRLLKCWLSHVNKGLLQVLAKLIYIRVKYHLKKYEPSLKKITKINLFWQYFYYLST